MPSSRLSRRTFLQKMGMAPVLLRVAPFDNWSLFHDPSSPPGSLPLSLDEFQLKAHYPAKSPLEDVLRFVAMGSDEFVTERYAFEIEQELKKWGASLIDSARDLDSLAKLLHPSIVASSLTPLRKTTLRNTQAIETQRVEFASQAVVGRDEFLKQLRDYFQPASRILTVQFDVISLKQISESPLDLQVGIRYDFVFEAEGRRREERIGQWQMRWTPGSSGTWKIQQLTAGEESRSIISSPGFVDITEHALGSIESYRSQLLHGTDYWRTVLDGACGIDVYGNNGIAAGDFDNDGFDDLYICQPGGLPNRLYRNRGDGTFEDVTESAGIGVLDNTACAIFADFRNSGRQDLLVVCGTGPLLFLNQGNGTFQIKRDAFTFARDPQGTFTHAAVADYDRDGKLDIYFCLYSYYLGLDQYHYPVPYFDARNGPPNFLLHNEGDGRFTDRTEAAGLNKNNNRYSFACAWQDSHVGGLPDLYIANDFGRSNLYRNNGDGTFTDISAEAHVDDVGAGMSAAWSDIDNHGRPDVYAANMWSAAGQRITEQAIFHEGTPEDILALYRRHARGNSLYRNLDNGTFQNVTDQAGVAMGRWSWSSDFWDFDHDGYSDLYVANGYISGSEDNDLASFFWRQVVAKSPDDSTPTQAYERGWNALNELIRSDNSWSGYERNVMFANNHDGTFTEVSGAVGLDFIEDSRSFALADIDHDGRLEIILKNRNAPQLRIIRNALNDIGHSVSFRLRGTRSNRDAIGSTILLEAGPLKQTKSLQAGSGFLAQHSKELFFGLASHSGPVRATVQWPSGHTQSFEDIPIGHRVEIEEGWPQFAAKPFTALPANSSHPTPAPPIDQTPASFGTWLIEPIKAPEFSLSGLDGKKHDLNSLRGSFTLLTFWTAQAPKCRTVLTHLHQHRAAFNSAGLKVLAINTDEDVAPAKSLARQLGPDLPIVFANAETAGIYNLIFRYLYDRRRDLVLPTSFLIDREGMIVKVYQGMDAEQLLKDVRSAPASGSERVARALPFPGTVYQDAFHRNDFTYGVAFFQHGYLDAAAESFQQVVLQKPNDAEAFYNLGTLSLHRNDLPAARRHLEQTIKLRPEYPEAWNNLGMVAAQQGLAVEAIRDFQQALDLRPTYTIALLNLGNLYRRQRAFDKALVLFSRALQIQPDDAEANYSMGMLYAQQGQLEQASDYLQKAAELRPGYPEVLNNLGVIYVRTGDYGHAEEQFKTCIRLTPSFDQSYINLAQLYAIRNEKEQAIQVLQQLLALQPQNPTAQRALEMLLRP
ncbi:FG-GAP-like repeat-containing protein [Edaphobacter sp. HDX4]|uniref:FG-GAP-like repeat-containing protein n=1 Tax=Edaphobacter sp. HDX4 TaxID=2794064 RepID=UPI002FE60F43